MTPDRFTIEERIISVGEGHELYSQAWGNPDAEQTVIFLHGGPGSGCRDNDKTIFDPTKYRVIFFDQRGSGRSTPYGSIANNTTQDLIRDVIKVANAYDAKQFTLFGRSWGSCLALAVAIKHPERVTRVVVGGVFTGSPAEIDYLERGRFANYFPEVWEKYVASVPKSYQDNPSEFHFKRMFGDDLTKSQESALAHSELEMALLRLDDRTPPIDGLKFDPQPTMIECHYLANQCFLPPNYLLDQAHKLTMPIFIIQGRYDIVCPPITAYTLAKRAPNAKMLWTQAGHSFSDRSNWDVTRTLFEAL